MAGAHLALLNKGRRIGRQGDHPAQGFLPLYISGVQYHRATLGKTGKDNACQVDAFCLLGLDQANHLIGRGL
ncbi:hypothetical protein D3C79_691630 [compost metagenome]